MMQCIKIVIEFMMQCTKISNTPKNENSWFLVQQLHQFPVVYFVCAVNYQNWFRSGAREIGRPFQCIYVQACM